MFLHPCWPVLSISLRGINVTFPKKKKKRVERILELAAEAGSIAMSLRDKPTRLDWLSVGLRAVAMGIQLQAERQKSRAKSPWSYFGEDDREPTWIAIPESLGRLVLKQVHDFKIVEDHWDEEEDSERVCVGLLEEEEVGWLADSNGQIVDGPYIRVARQKETHVALGNCLWREFGSNNLLFDNDGLSIDTFVDTQVLTTTQFDGLLKRTSSFLDRNVSRSFLLAGPPGTGKSTGMRLLAKRLRLRTLRVDIKVLSQQHRGSELTTSIETLVRALAPEALILDDIDRVQHEEKLIHFFELANRSCKLVLASVNALDELSTALKRPGRFDEIVEVTQPDPRVVQALLGQDCDLAKQIESLPMAYVAEFVKRRDVLGREEALRELPKLIERHQRSQDKE